MNTQSIAVVLIIAGVLLLAGSTRLLGWLGHLPGDFQWHRGNSSLYFPLATCLMVSLILSLILWLFGRR